MRISSAASPPASEEDERGDDEALADRLVVDGRRTSRQTRAGRVQVRSSVGAASRGRRGDRVESAAWCAVCSRAVSLISGSPGRRRAPAGRPPTACIGGMLVPGLIRLRIRRSSPPRLPRRVRQRAGGDRLCGWRCASGRARVAAGDVPWIVWHMRAGAVDGTRRCRAALSASVGCAAGWRWPAARRRTVPAARRSPTNAIMRVLVAAELGALAAVHAGLVGLERMIDVRPGIRSFLPCRFGTQKLWITSSASA